MLLSGCYVYLYSYQNVTPACIPMFFLIWNDSDQIVTILFLFIHVISLLMYMITITFIITCIFVEKQFHQLCVDHNSYSNHGKTTFGLFLQLNVWCPALDVLGSSLQDKSCSSCTKFHFCFPLTYLSLSSACMLFSSLRSVHLSCPFSYYNTLYRVLCWLGPGMKNTSISSSLCSLSYNIKLFHCHRQSIPLSCPPFLCSFIRDPKRGYILSLIILIVHPDLSLWKREVGRSVIEWP